MTNESEPGKGVTGGKNAQELEALMDIAREHNVPIDAAVNPFIDEEARQKIIKGEEQDPEWD